MQLWERRTKLRLLRRRQRCVQREHTGVMVFAHPPQMIITHLRPQTFIAQIIGQRGGHGAVHFRIQQYFAAAGQ